MGQKNSKRATVTMASESGGEIDLDDFEQRTPARPRLGAPHDSWSTVLKDVVREAPRTALVTAGMVVLALIGLITALTGIIVGYGTTTPALTNPPQAPVVQIAIEFVRGAF